MRRALIRLERAMGICQEANISVFFPRMAAALGAAYILAGRIADALSLLTQAMEQTTTVEMVGFQALCSLPLGEAHLLASHLEEAQALAERALALTCEHQERSHQAYALRLLGNIAVHHAPLDVNAAAAYYRQAQVLAESLGMRPLVAHCHLGLGKLYQRTSKREQAREHLTTATTMYREMGMPYWLEQAEAELDA
jgi:tetratricopeptide (TPR) repeat protein